MQQILYSELGPTVTRKKTSNFVLAIDDRLGGGAVSISLSHTKIASFRCCKTCSCILTVSDHGIALHDCVMCGL